MSLKELRGPGALCAFCRRPVLPPGTDGPCPKCRPSPPDRKDRAPFDPARRAGVRAPDGRAICRGCGEPVAKGRRSWCSDGCENHYLARIHPRALIGFLRERDGGDCQRCGIDLVALERRIDRMTNPPHATAWEAFHVRRRAWNVLTAMGYNRTSPTEVDHRVPLADGGGLMGPENLRLLCTRCHKAVTAEWRASRARRRRSAARRERRQAAWRNQATNEGAKIKGGQPRLPWNHRRNSM